MRKFLFIATILLLITTSILLWVTEGSTPASNEAPAGQTITPTSSMESGKALIGGAFVLTNQDGNEMRDEMFRGKLMLVFFGFTSCPDICPTTTARITRAADLIRKTGITSLIGQSEGTVYFEVEVTNEARPKWFFTLDSGSNSFIQAWISSSRTINIQIQNNASIVMVVLASSALTVGYHKVAFAYNTATNGCIMYIDGVQNPVATRTVGSPGLPTFNNFTFGSYLSTTADTLKAHVRAGAVYPNRISDLDLEFLTAPVTYTTYAQMANALSYILP
jgi:hypothetical protein